MGCLHSVKKRFTTIPLAGEKAKKHGSGQVPELETKVSKYLLRFPKINKAYQHLFDAWCATIEKTRPKGTAAIFELSGSRDKVFKALSLSGITTTEELIAKALEAND